MDDARLLPPIREIHDRLTRNQRERYVLRTLLRLALRDTDDQPHQEAHQPSPEAARLEVTR
jgi:hypothetical protein